jgi:hypothetical protein
MGKEMSGRLHINFFNLKWIIYAVLIRLLISLFFVSQAKELTPDRVIDPFFIKQNDYYMFLGVVDNFFETGVFEIYRDSGVPFAGRMPGYSLPYLILRVLFHKIIALQLLALIQIFLSAIAAFCIGKITQLYTNSKLGFWVGLHLYLFSGALSYYDVFTLSESFSFSALVIFFYFWTKYFWERNIHYLWIAGLFLTWAIFLRPFLGLLLPYCAIRLLLFFDCKLNLLIKPLLLFFLSFIIIESIWIVRNYKELGRFIPLQTSLPESYGENGIYNSGSIAAHVYLVRSLGGDNAEFREGSEGWWFLWAEGDDFYQYQHNKFVRQNDCINEEGLQKMALRLRESFNPDNEEYFFISKEVEAEANNCISCIRLNYPIKYYIWDPLKRAFKYVISNPTYLMPLPRLSDMMFFQKIVKIYSMSSYYLFTIIGFVFFIQMIFRPFSYSAIDFVGIPVVILFSLVYFGLVLEPRYSLQFHFLFILISAIATTNLINKKNLFKSFFNGY